MWEQPVQAPLWSSVEGSGEASSAAEQLAGGPGSGLPKSVTIWEVGPRDGLQNERGILGTGVKLEFIHRLASHGLPVVETTSFVHPKWVPQLADADSICAGLRRAEGVRYPVLVPNPRGWQRAQQAGVSDIAVFASATESFAQRNLNSTLDGQFSMFEPVVREAVAAGVHVRGYVSMVFGDPWEGAVPVEQVVSVARKLLDLGCWQLSLGDTIGVATPGQVAAVLAALAEAGMGPDKLAVHFHDTYGQALANTYTALSMGVSTVDSSAGGLGGCPFAGSATGNLATEDLVWLLSGLGIEHGVDLAGLVTTSQWMAEQLGKPSPSRVVQARAQASTPGTSSGGFGRPRSGEQPPAEPQTVPGGLRAVASPPGPRPLRQGQRNPEVVAFVLHQFPIGHLPIAVSTPAEQLPVPESAVDGEPSAEATQTIERSRMPGSGSEAESRSSSSSDSGEEAAGQQADSQGSE